MGSLPELLDQIVVPISTGPLHGGTYDNTNTKFLVMYKFPLKHWSNHYFPSIEK